MKSMVLIKIWVLFFGAMLEIHPKTVVFLGYAPADHNEYQVGIGLLGVVLIFKWWAFWKGNPPNPTPLLAKETPV